MRQPAEAMIDPFKRGIVMTRPLKRMRDASPPHPFRAVDNIDERKELLLRFESATSLENNKPYYAVAWIVPGKQEATSLTSFGPSPSWTHEDYKPDFCLELPLFAPVNDLFLHIEVVRAASTEMNREDDDPQCSNGEVVVGRARIKLSMKWWKKAYEFKLRLVPPPWKTNKEQFEGKVRLTALLRPQPQWKRL